MKKKIDIKNLILDILYAIAAGVIVGTAYHFFQNSNGFAPGGVGGLATITHHLLEDRVSWSVLMIAFNLRKKRPSIITNPVEQISVG